MDGPGKEGVGLFSEGMWSAMAKSSVCCSLALCGRPGREPGLGSVGLSGHHDLGAGEWAGLCSRANWV